MSTRPLWRQILYDIWHEKATRNDFESHGYNAYTWIVWTMALAMQFTSYFWEIGILGGLAGLMIRELVIDKRHPQGTDIISGVLAIIAACLTIAGIRAALCI